MQAMKAEKDNLMDRCDAMELAMKEAVIRRNQTEEEANMLTNKSKTLEVEVDQFTEKLAVAQLEQKSKEDAVMAAEAEFNRLNRRVQELEEDLENTETKCVLGSSKLDKAATTADEMDRMAKVLQNRANEDELKLQSLDKQNKEAEVMAEEADKKYDEAAKKMYQCEGLLEISDERAAVGELKIIELEEELKVVANNLKSLEVSEDKANQREEYYKDEIKRVTQKLKQAETRSEFAERSVQKLQKEVDRLEDELVGEQEKFKAITEELDQTFAEMSGY